MTEPRARVVLIGAPGAGKTRTGKRLARLLGYPLIDTDKKIVAAHGPIAAIFAEHGEARFRQLEREAVAAALREPAIVTLGGGAVLDADTRADLASLRVVQLTVQPEAVEDRIEGGKRPLVADGIASWVALVAARRPIYDELSSLTIDTSSRPLDSVAADIAAWLDSPRLPDLL